MLKNSKSNTDDIKPDNSDSMLELPASPTSEMSVHGNNNSNSCHGNKHVPSLPDEVTLSEPPVDMPTVKRPDLTVTMEVDPLKTKKRHKHHKKGWHIGDI